MEESISKSRIQLLNTSSSYAQYLESLPNNNTKEHDKIAQIILKASKYLSNNCKRLVIVMHYSMAILMIMCFGLKFQNWLGWTKMRRSNINVSGAQERLIRRMWTNEPVHKGCELISTTFTGSLCWWFVKSMSYLRRFNCIYIILNKF